MDTMKDTKMQPATDAVIEELLDRLEEARTAWKEADKACRDLTEKVIPNLRESLEAAEKRTAKLEERCAVLTASLRLAVRQNNHDMLMTAEELRSCEATLEESK